MSMLSCRICSGTCDPGDFRDGVCDVCRYEERRKNERNQEMDRLSLAKFKQIRLEELYEIKY